jgi:uncharacterized protein (TIGR03083 family)
MSELAVDGFRAERASLLEIANSLSDEEWNAPSDCEGWTVRDVYANLASTIHGIVDPAFMADMSGGTEAAMEAPVAERRSRPIADVLAEYEEFSAKAADAGAMLQGEGVGDTLLPMGDLGTHPMRLLPNILLFDSYCHLRNDILKPNGPIDRPQPPNDEQRVGPTVEWMMAGLPWMCDRLAAIVDRPLVLEFTGAGGGTFTIAPGGEDGRVAITNGAAPNAAATATSSAVDFVVWGTQRRPWRDYVKVEGDEAYAAQVLDEVNVI